MADDDDKMAALDRWARALVAELGLDVTVGEGRDIDVAAILDLASVAAHSVMRPAAPLTTYLVGYAAGLAATAGNDATNAFAVAQQLAAAQSADGVS
jgi:hypothetical protein